MMITFCGLETVLNCSAGTVTVFEIEDQAMFASICQSFVSGLRDQAVEPYMLWDDDGEPVKSRDHPTVIVDPFALPWNDRLLVGALSDRLDKLLLEDDSVRAAIDRLGETLSTQILGLALQLEGDYGFGIEWEVPRFLKSFGFAPEQSLENRLIDNLENYVSVIADVGIKKLLVFVNLRKFLSALELDRFCKHVKNLNCAVLMLESTGTEPVVKDGIVHGVDQRFIEY